MFKKYSLPFLALLFPYLAIAQGFSNQGDATENNDQYTAEQLISFSKKVEKSLAERGARVAIVSRVGRPESELPEGVKYTHVAFWVYSDITAQDGRKLKGYQVYNLYQREGQKNISDLISDFPLDFYAGVYSLKSGVIIPKPSLQEKLLQIIDSSDYRKLHNSNYSVVAKMDSKRYQNCTGFTLNVLFSAIYGTSDRAQLTANKRTYFKPQAIKIGSVKRVLGSMFVQDFFPEEHGGEIKTATYSTIANFMKDYDLGKEIYEIEI
ncbi:DUF2145 domain-containing protein [Pseudomonas tohonis]|nr:hypothetical protein L682_24190 [Pseudomonas alcaligenes OT 69]MDN4149279.1 DUF2145 domain-containing protein [Pseudomonas tohonis]